MTVKPIDLRSDTVTLPSPEMRQAMANASVGDDVMREDPTVRELEELAAEMLGKEAALLVTSGTMGNLIALLAHCGRADEVILGRLSHIHIEERGGMSALGGIHGRTVANQPDGTLELAELDGAINSEDIHHAPTRLICLENTWMGRALPLDYMDQVRTLALKHELQVHLDGARLFNAALAVNATPAKIASYADSVQFCLSKGLASPVGSLLCGSSHFIDRARKIRKMIGGGMRQAGVLAACGLVSLRQMVNRLQEDHDNAKQLAAELANIPGIKVDGPHTNMVFIHSATPGVNDAELLKRMAESGVLAFCEQIGIRLVTHYGIESEDILEAARRIAQACKSHVRS